MNKYLDRFKKNCISGVLFLLPIFILLILIKKIFGYFAKFGSGIAKFSGLDEMFGKNAANFFGVLILLILIVVSGYLVRLAFFKKISDEIDLKLKEIIPGYEKQKELAQTKILEKQKIVTDLPVLIQFGEYWQPGFLVEQDTVNAVVAVPIADGKELYIVPIQNF